MKTPTTCLAFLALVTSHTAARAQSTVLVSHFGNQTSDDYASYMSGSISADGRYVTFIRDHLYNLFPALYESTLYVSAQSSLIPLEYNNGFHNFYYWEPQVSSDGHFVAYAREEGGGSYFGAPVQVYVRAIPSGAPVLVSVNSQGIVADHDSQMDSISADGRFITFSSGATNLDGGAPGLFIRDLGLGLTEVIDVDSNGVHGNGASGGTAISEDGRFVAFGSSATNLVLNDTNGHLDIFLRDRSSGTTECLSLGLTGNPGNGDSSHVSMSADGRFVAFSSIAGNLVPNDTNNTWDVFVRDRVAQVTRRVSLGAANAQGNSASRAPSISADGRFVAFQSTANNLVANDINSGEDVFVRDRLWNVTELVSVSSNGTQGAGNNPHISASGRFVLFESTSSNLTPEINHDYPNVFLRDRGAALSHAYCAGDGLATACPCGNDSALGSGTGCLNSLGTGARLTVTGEASLASDTLVLHGNGMPDSAALYFQGTAVIAGGAGAAFGDGLRCVGGTLFRFAPKQNVGGASAYPGTNDPSVSSQGHVTTTGSRYYQVRYRNSAIFCTSDTFNMSNGLELVWSP